MIDRLFSDSYDSQTFSAFHHHHHVNLSFESMKNLFCICLQLIHTKLTVESSEACRTFTGAIHINTNSSVLTGTLLCRDLNVKQRERGR